MKESAGAADAEPSAAEPSAAEPSAAEPSAAEPSAAAAPAPASNAKERETESGKTTRFNSAQGSTAELGAIALALLFGGVGFAFRLLWIPAMLLMAGVFGLLLAERRASQNRRGVVSEIVANVAHEAREIVEAASVTPKEEDKSNESDGSNENKVAADVDDGVAPVDQTHIEAPEKRNGDAGSISSEREELELGDHIRSNGHSPLAEVGGPVSGKQSNGVVKKETVVNKAVESVGLETVPTGQLKSESAEVTAEATKTVEVEGVASVDQGSSTSHHQRDAPSLFPARLFLSADRAVARNPLLRPMRKRFLGAATSLSRTIVHLANVSADSETTNNAKDV